MDDAMFSFLCTHCLNSHSCDVLKNHFLERRKTTIGIVLTFKNKTRVT